MKKLLFVAIALCGFTVARSQALAAPSTNTIHTTLNLANVLELQVNGDNDDVDAYMSASFGSEEDYENGVVLAQTGNFSGQTVPFSYSSNRHVNISVKSAAANFTYSGSINNTGDNVMPCSVLSWQLVGNNTGGTGAATGWHALSTSTAAVITNGEEGGDDTQNFGMQLMANPGFNYIGGTYTLDVVVTATQL